MTAEGAFELHTYNLAHQPVGVLVHPSEGAAALYGRKHAALVDFLYDKRHGEYRGRTDLLYRLQQQGRNGRFLQIIYGSAAEHRIEHSDCHLQSVSQRQEREPAVLAVPLAGTAAGNHVRGQVPVGQDHALGTSGSPGCVYDCGDVVRSGDNGLSVTGKTGIIGLYDLQGIHIHDEFHRIPQLCTHPGSESLRDEKHIGTGVAHYVVDFVFGAVRKYGNGNPAEGDSAEESHRPVRHALTEYGHLVPFAYSVLRQEFGYGIAFEFETSVGVAALGIVVPGGKTLFREDAGRVVIQLCKRIDILLPHLARSLIELHHLSKVLVSFRRQR